MRDALDTTNYRHGIPNFFQQKTTSKRKLAKTKHKTKIPCVFHAADVKEITEQYMC